MKGGFVIKTVRELAEEMGIGKQVVLNKMNADPLRHLLSNLENGMERGPRNIIYLSEEAEALIRRAFIKSDIPKTSYNKIRQINNANRVPHNNSYEEDSLVSEVSSMVSEFGSVVSDVGSAASQLNSTTSELRSAASELNFATSEVKSAASELSYATTEVRSMASAVNSMTATTGASSDDSRRALRADFKPLINKPAPPVSQSTFKMNTPVVMQTEQLQPRQLDESVAFPVNTANPDIKPTGAQTEHSPLTNEVSGRYIDELKMQINFLKSEMSVKDGQLKAKDDQLKAKDIQISAKDDQIKEFQGYIKSVIDTANNQRTTTADSSKISSNIKDQGSDSSSELKGILNSVEKRPGSPKKRSIFDTPLPETVQQRAKVTAVAAPLVEQPQFNNVSPVVPAQTVINVNPVVPAQTTIAEDIPTPAAIVEASQQQIHAAAETVLQAEQPQFNDFNTFNQPNYAEITEDEYVPMPAAANHIPHVPIEHMQQQQAQSFAPAPAMAEAPPTTNAANVAKSSILDTPLREMEYVESGYEPGVMPNNVYDINQPVPAPAGGGFKASFNFPNNFQPVNDGQNYEESYEEIDDDYYDDEEPSYYQEQPRGLFSKFLRR